MDPESGYVAGTSGNIHVVGAVIPGILAAINFWPVRNGGKSYQRL